MTTGLVRTLPLASSCSPRLPAVSDSNRTRRSSRARRHRTWRRRAVPGGLLRLTFPAGSTWQYTVTALNGSTSLKYVSIDAKAGHGGRRWRDHRHGVSGSHERRSRWAVTLITLQQACWRSNRQLAGRDIMCWTSISNRSWRSISRRNEPAWWSTATRRSLARRRPFANQDSREVDGRRSRAAPLTRVLPRPFRRSFSNKDHRNGP